MNYIDQLGNNIVLASTPKRIVSLVPSQTELLFDLGLREEVVGITKFCIHPNEWFRSKARVGGTKQLNLKRIAELKPDLIIANKEENTQEQIHELKNHFPVWISDINTLQDALDMIATVGEMCGKGTNANTLISSIQSSFQSIEKIVLESKKVLYLIWDKPMIGVGTKTFIHQMLLHLGFENALGIERYPEMDSDLIITLQPDYIFLSSEPYPFRASHFEKFQTLFPHAKVIFVDGEMFSWYGSRLRLSASYLATLIQQL